MPLNEYELSEHAGSLLVEWMKPTLPIEIKMICLGVLVLLPFLFIFRRPIARFSDRHLHIHWSPTVFGILAPLMSLVCGVLLFFVREPAPKIFWGLGPIGITVKTPNGPTSLRWSDVDSAAYDAQNPEKTTLVLKSKEGQNIQLVLAWVAPEHQDKILGFINQSTKNRFNLKALEEPEDESDNDEIPFPIKPPSK